jgi:phage terminase small subunit
MTTEPTPNTGGGDTDSPLPIPAPSASEPKPKRIRQRSMTGQQREFLCHYIKCWNATKAARRAGYSPHTAHVIGSKLLRNPRIQAAIAPMMKSMHLTPERVLSRLAAIAGADFSDFLSAADGSIDLEKIKSQGHLVKCLEKTKYGYRLELHDALRALELIGKAQRMFNDSAQSNEVKIQFNVNVSGDCV